MKNLFQNCKLQINGICYVLPSEVILLLQQGAILVDLREKPLSLYDITTRKKVKNEKRKIQNAKIETCILLLNT